MLNIQNVAGDTPRYVIENTISDQLDRTLRNNMPELRTCYWHVRANVRGDVGNCMAHAHFAVSRHILKVLEHDY